MKKIIPYWNRVIFVFLFFFSLFIGIDMRYEMIHYGRGNETSIIKLTVILLCGFGIVSIFYFLHFIEYDEENNYICYSNFGRKFKARLSDVSYVGYLPFGIDGSYQIRYGTEKALPFFCLFGKKKMKELYEAVKKKNPNCEYGF